MPISRENAARYPDDWPEISRRIRFDRAGGRCECRGECGRDHSTEPYYDFDQGCQGAFMSGPIEPVSRTLMTVLRRTENLLE